MDELGLAIGGGTAASPQYYDQSAPQYYDQSAKMVRMPSLKTRLEGAVRQAEQRLAEAKRAREIFDKHPELEELLNIMQRGHF